MKTIFILCLLYPQYSNGASVDDVMSRANLSSYLPALSMRYAYGADSHHVIWLQVTWEFDEILVGPQVFAAMEIQNLEREQKRLYQKSVSLDDDHLPTND